MLVKPDVAFANPRADPAFLGTGAGRGAGVDHRFERGIAGHGELAAPQRAGQGFRKMEPLKRQNRPHSRLHPEDFGIVTTVRHRENPGTIGLEQKLGRDGMGIVAGHNLQ